MKKCPFCAEEIQDEAIKCKHCGSDVEKKSQVKVADPSKSKNLTWLWWLISISLLIKFIGCVNNLGSKNVAVNSEETKTHKIAQFIQKEVNTGGFSGCSCEGRVETVFCDIKLPAGTSTDLVISNTKGVADLFAQVNPLGAMIYYDGFSGNQKVCEFKYDMYSHMVTKEF